MEKLKYEKNKISGFICANHFIILFIDTPNQGNNCKYEEAYMALRKQYMAR